MSIKLQRITFESIIWMSMIGFARLIDVEPNWHASIGFVIPYLIYELHKGYLRRTSVNILIKGAAFFISSTIYITLDICFSALECSFIKVFGRLVSRNINHCALAAHFFWRFRSSQKCPCRGVIASAEVGHGL